LVVGGVTLEHHMGPISHSDGDALYHAVTDAILGALALPDIGQLFPDTDARHESQNSADFLAAACKLALEQGYAPTNIDATVILERPKLSPVKDQMRANIAQLLGMPIAAVNVKAKTHEKVDAVGEGRAIEVHVVMLLTRTAPR
jgi:2-C-methyl-D-erythritol 2,4-cyclodiphosphate synthase